MNKILVVANLYPSKDDPSYGTFVKEFTDELVAFFPSDNISISVIRGRTNSVFLKALKYLSFFFRTLLKLMFHRYDLVYVHYISHSIPPIWLASKIKKLKLAFNIHGDDLMVRSKQGEFFLKMARSLMCNSKLVVVPSTFFEDELKERIPEIGGENVFVSPSGGIDKSFFFPVNVNSKKSNDVIHLGYVSRIDTGKGWNVLVEAVNILIMKDEQVEVSIIGTGAQVNDLECMLEEYNLRGCIHYLGAQPRNQLPVIYECFDLFIFPTLLQESLGLVGIEAMAASVPVIGSNIGGLKGYIKDEVNGYLFEKGNAKDLSDKIMKFKNLSKEDKINMCNNAFETALRFESKKVSKELFNRVKNLYRL